MCPSPLCSGRKASACAAGEKRLAAADTDLRLGSEIDLAHGFPTSALRAHKTAGGHLFALLEEEHSEQLAAEITSALLLESEGEILHMLRARDVLDSQVAAMVLVHRVETLESVHDVRSSK